MFVYLAGVYGFAFQCKTSLTTLAQVILLAKELNTIPVGHRSLFEEFAYSNNASMLQKYLSNTFLMNFAPKVTEDAHIYYRGKHLSDDDPLQLSFQQHEIIIWHNYFTLVSDLMAKIGGSTTMVSHFQEQAMPWLKAYPEQFLNVNTTTRRVMIDKEVATKL